MMKQETTMQMEQLRRAISNEGSYKRKLQDTSFVEIETTKKIIYVISKLFKDITKCSATLE